MDVIFRKWIKGPGDVIAILPEVEANPGMHMMYEHVGQHGEGNYAGVLERTRLATPAEYAPLLAELQHIYAPLELHPVAKLRYRPRPRAEGEPNEL